MSIARPRRHLRRGFTLIEITLAVAILGMMSLAIYRFVATNLTALRVSAAASVIDAQYSGFASLLSSQWTSLPPGRGALTGEPLKLNNRSRDEITWICGAGQGLLTRYATGEYQVSLRLRPVADNGDALELGLLRQPYDRGKAEVEGEETWVPLLRNIESVKITYFDPRLNTWVEKWTDTLTLPRLVKLIVARTDAPAPWEAIIPLGRTPL